MSELRGGIDLGGTKIQTAIVDARGRGARRGAPADPDLGRAGGRRPGDGGGAARGGIRGRGRAGGSATASESALPVTPTRRPASSRRPETCPAGRAASRSATRSARPSDTRVRVGNDVQVATEAEFHLGAAREFSSLIGVFWGTGVGGGLILDGKPWLGRGAAGEIGHMVVKRGGAKCPCGRKGCLEAYAGRSAMEAEARRQHEEGYKTDLFKLMEKHGKERLTSGVWERALDHGDRLAREADRARDRGARHRDRLGREPARPRGRGDRRRPRRSASGSATWTR